MTDDTTDTGLPDRERIEPITTAKRRDALPLLYLLGFVILAVALFFLWRNPPRPRQMAQETAQVSTLEQDANDRRQELAALSARVGAIEAKPAPVAPVATPPVDLGPIQARLDALEKRSAPAAVDLGPLNQKVAALEARPLPAPPADLGPLQAGLAAVAKQAGDLGPQVAQLGTRLDGLDATQKTLATRVAALDADGKKTAAALAEITNRAGLAAKLQAAAAALDAGQRLGDIPGAPAALSRFAHDAPPTQSALRLSFDSAATAAAHDSQPAITDDQPLLNRMWTRAQQAVTVRQGDRILLGDPVAGVLQHARQALDAGDLAGAVSILDGPQGLAGPAKAAMADWVGQAKALLAARAAIADMAAHI